MAKFLNTSALNYYLEEIIKTTQERLVLISPYLRLNDRIRELLEDKNRLKIDIRIIYGKSDLHPEEVEWLRGLDYIRTSFCKNLHAKCYLNEAACIIGSLNLYDFSQVNNNEMGVWIDKAEDGQLYADTYDEAQRLIRISDEVKISLERIKSEEVANDDAGSHGGSGKLTSSKLAAKLGCKTKELNEKLLAAGYLEKKDDLFLLTDLGKSKGGEFRKGKFGVFFLWPEDLQA